MPRLRGQSLNKTLKHRTRLPIDESLRIFLQMTDGFAAAHRQKVIHRDIKPGNVMTIPGEDVGRDKVVIVDFGIAKLIPQAEDPTMKETTTGNIFGTPLYMSPEQCLGKQIIDGRSDIYSMGCLMYEVLTGKPPFIGKATYLTLRAQVEDPPEAITVLNGERSWDVYNLNNIITKMLEKEPGRRYQSMDEVHETLVRANNISLKMASIEQSFPLVTKPIMDLMDFMFTIGLQLRSYSSRRANTVRTSKLTGTLMAFALVIVSCAAVAAIAPYIVTKDPSISMTDIKWQSVSPPPLRSAEQFKSREKQLSFAYGTEQSSGPSPELFGTLKDIAELYYENQLYSKAAGLYMSALKVGKELEEKGIETQASDMAAISLPAAFCFYRLGQYNGAFSTCETGLEFAKKGNARAGKPVFFRGILAGSYGFLIENKRAEPKYLEAGTRNAKADATVFMALLKQDDFKPEESYEIGLLASDVGDYYLRNGQPKMAAEAYKYSLRAWTTLDEAGAYNRAVADVRLGLVNRQQGNLHEAAELLDKAAAIFASNGASSDLERARTLFCLADTYWQMKDLKNYMRSILTRTEAVRTWRVTKKA
jgi:serine/threonine protein kinase